MNFKEFQNAMLSEVSNFNFKAKIKELRKQVIQNDFTKVSSDVIYLPTELEQMLSFLYKKAIKAELKQ